jgi:serine/threonine protein kinase
MLAGESPFYWEGIDQMTLFQSIIEDDYKSPTNASADAIHLIDQLLIKDPEKRLGSRKENAILEHKWFRDLDLSAMRCRKVRAPWVPTVSDPLDTSNFEDWGDLEDKLQQSYPALDARDSTMFDSSTLFEQLNGSLFDGLDF